MSSKNFRSQTRLNEHERQLEAQRQDMLVTADRTAWVAHKQIVRDATTIDDGGGQYPPDPAGGDPDQEYLRQVPHVLPIVFNDLTIPNTPGQASISATPMSLSQMTLALCSQWYPPGTDVVVWHQNRFWIEISGVIGGPAIKQKAIWAWAKIDELSAGNPSQPAECVDPLPVVDINEIFWGIFQIPWDDVTGGTGSQGTWANGDAMQWANGDPFEWASAPSAQWEWANGDLAEWANGDPMEWAIDVDTGKLDADNPLQICGKPGDIVLLAYQGETKPPFVVEVLHRCNEAQIAKWNPNTCTLEYDSLLFCSPTTYWRPDDEPGVPANGSIVSFDTQTVQIDTYWDPNTCEILVVYQDVCTILQGPPSNALPVLDIRDLQDPCCPCPPCPTDCTPCNTNYDVQVGTWSTPDCGCMDVNVQVGRAGCRWDYIDFICDDPMLGQTAGNVDILIECVNNRWLITIIYGTAGTNNDVWVETTFDIGPAGTTNPCPPTGTFNVPQWDYQFGSRVCIDNAETVTIS